MYICMYIYIYIYTSTIYFFSYIREGGAHKSVGLDEAGCFFLGPNAFWSFFYRSKSVNKKCLIVCREFLMYKPRFRGTPHAKYANAYFIQCRINNLKAIICDRGASNSRSLSRTRETPNYSYQTNRGPPV